MKRKSFILRSIIEEPKSPHKGSLVASPKSTSFLSTASKEPRDQDHHIEESEPIERKDFKRANTFNEYSRSNTVNDYGRSKTLNEYTFDSKWADVNTDDDFYCFSPRHTTIPKHNFVSCGAASRPHPDKIKTGGEDSYFFNQNLLVVADGVGSWIQLGIDPKQHSKALCQSFQTLWEKNSDLYQDSAKILFTEAAENTKVSGSSTCCSIILHKHKKMIESCYMGDAGYMILRKKISGEIEEIFASTPHCKSFNFPYQVGLTCDPPELALSFTHEVKHGDIIVMGSDGLFDNVSHQEIIKHLTPYFAKPVFRIKEAVESLANLAKNNSSKLFYLSPFAKNSVKNWTFSLGGKPDDITILLAQVNLKSF